MESEANWGVKDELKKIEILRRLVVSAGARKIDANLRSLPLGAYDLKYAAASFGTFSHILQAKVTWMRLVRIEPSAIILDHD